MNLAKSILFCSALLAFVADASAVTMIWSYVGNAGNANDGTGLGAVGYNFNIGTYDVTNNQYVEFLNAKDPTGTSPLRLYNADMSSPHGGINYNSGALGGSKYSVVSGRGNWPANATSWYDAVRFANWINNGQGNGDTETGAYTLGSLGAFGIPTKGLSITRNAGATVFLPTENEWYKAAYNIPGTNSYNLYPTSSSLVPTATGPTATPNSANYNNAVGNLTDVSAYSGTSSPYGVFGMAGNVYQWNEAVDLGLFRKVRGVSFTDSSEFMKSSTWEAFNPTLESYDVGFRVATVPEPSTFALAAFGFIALAWRLRRR